LDILKCNLVENCSQVYEGTAKCHVIETDNKCTLDTNGNCIKRDSATLNYERCEFRINNIDSTK
jgi:hypothetical protein